MKAIVIDGFYFGRGNIQEEKVDRVLKYKITLHYIFHQRDNQVIPMKKTLLVLLATMLAFCSFSIFATDFNKANNTDEAPQTVLTSDRVLQPDSCSPTKKFDLGTYNPSVSVYVRVYSLMADKDTSSLNLQNMYDKSKSNDRLFRNKLSSYGRVQLLTEVNLVTLDRNPAPFNVSTESSDLIEYKPTLNQANPLNLVDTSTFSGVFTPTILGSNNLDLITCLNYTVVKHSVFDGLTLPNTSMSQQVNHTKMESGKTNVSTWYQLDSGKNNQIIVLTTSTIL